MIKNKIILGLIVTVLFCIMISCKKSYQDALNEGNYNLARELAEREKDKYGYSPSEWDIQKRIKEINEIELNELITENNPQNTDRILYIYNNYKNTEGSLPDMTKMLNLAITLHNEDLAQKLLQSDVLPNDDTAKVAVISDMEDVVIMLLQSDPSFIMDNKVYNYLKSKKSDDSFQDLISSTLFSYYNYILNHKPNIISTGIHSNRYVGMYDKNNKFGPGVDSYYEIEQTVFEDNEKINKYNHMLEKLIDFAIYLDNKELARKAANALIPNLEYQNMKDNKAKVTYNNQNINELKSLKMLN